MISSSKSINGFKVLALKFSDKCTSTHDLFIKEHSVRHHDEKTPKGRTLFLLNIPPYVNEKSLYVLFGESVGKVESVLIEGDTGFKTAFVVFKSRDALLKALNLNYLRPISTKKQPVKTGLSKYVDEYNNSINDKAELIRLTNKAIEKLDKEIEITAKVNASGGTQDDDGWTVVTTKSRNPGLKRKESVEIKLNEKIKEKSQKKELKNFYTFQIRESKMKNIANLRKNYEEAKKKVTLMKNARRFKPY